MSLEEAEQYLRERRLYTARQAFDEAEAGGEDRDRCAAGRWMAAMLAGDFGAAWSESDALRARSAPDPHRLWDGMPLEGKSVIVRCLHGYGDAVQMLRYAPLLRANARRVRWEVAPEFVELARCIVGDDPVVTWGEGAPVPAPEWQSQIEVMELPFIFRSTLDDLPSPLPPHIPAKEQARVRSAMGARVAPTVGVVWSAGEWNRTRSLPFLLVRTLIAAVEGVSFWNLQGGEAGKSTDGMCSASQVCGDGLIALAATIANLDLVVTVDTLAAHLAGALGKPVWVLLQREADWRWLAEGETSAWYPTMRLLRQQHQGCWDEVATRVGAELKAWADLVHREAS